MRDRLDYSFENLCEQQVKSIARPMCMYRLRDLAILAEKPVATPPQPLPLPDKPLIAVLPYGFETSVPHREELCRLIVPAASPTGVRRDF